MRYSVEEAELYAEREGSGESVVLIHAHSVDRRMWDFQFKLLAQEYDVVRYDMRGYGLSDMPVPGARFGHAEDLKRLMDRMGIANAHLVGLSLGSFVALDMLALHPERTLSVVVSSGALFDGPTELPAKHLPPEGREIDMTAFKADWLKDLLSCCNGEDETFREKLSEMVMSWSGWQPRFETYLPIGGAATAQRLTEARFSNTPALVLFGELDSDGSRASCLALTSLLRQALFKTIPHAGHFCNLENASAYNRELLAFLRSACS
ncbi:alpha/beta fold hydrolase [Cohnella sp. GbtcB17]|uniref:alpha/beta fold hydrolase n=1 Tax=Cohnella sp. GbtcB17 TaxID=2824762 RepID=UPI001C2FCAD1|nr:alpha/beta hydrolase [Cohnella sp. GbtcB17]